MAGFRKEQLMSLTIGEEQPPTGEDDLITKLVALQVGIMMSKNPVRRGQHPKHHGCADVEFAVHGDIPEAYRIGLFKQPGTYQAKVRWSNGAAEDDQTADVHGMAVKVLGVKGTPALAGTDREEQDFILIDSEAFFVPDVRMMLELMTARVTSESAKDPKVMADFVQANQRIGAALGAARKQIASPLTTQYWSTVPYKLGSGAVKYTVVPSNGNKSGDIPATSRDYLRAALASQLGTGDTGAQFALCIIPQVDPADDPVENPMVPWRSVPIAVATITIRPQAFDTPERMKEGEDLSFDPWHALAEHRPLGGINRARRAVYAASLNLRQRAAAV
jgi:catalase